VQRKSNAWTVQEAPLAGGFYDFVAGGLDWRQAILSGSLTGTTLAVALLKADPTLKTEEEGVQAFVRSGKGSRATYFNHARKILTEQPVPRIILTHKPPVNPEPRPVQPYAYRNRLITDGRDLTMLN
jgi:hypothetical protein